VPIPEGVFPPGLANGERSLGESVSCVRRPPDATSSEVIVLVPWLLTKVEPGIGVNFPSSSMRKTATLV
jgi:hypothetical protein